MSYQYSNLLPSTSGAVHTKTLLNTFQVKYIFTFPNHFVSITSPPMYCQFWFRQSCDKIPVLFYSYIKNIGEEVSFRQGHVERYLSWPPRTALTMPRPPCTTWKRRYIVCRSSRPLVTRNHPLTNQRPGLSGQWWRHLVVSALYVCMVVQGGESGQNWIRPCDIETPATFPQLTILRYTFPWICITGSLLSQRQSVSIGPVYLYTRDWNFAKVFFLITEGVYIAHPSLEDRKFG